MVGNQVFYLNGSEKATVMATFDMWHVGERWAFWAESSHPGRGSRPMGCEAATQNYPDTKGYSGEGVILWTSTEGEIQ